MAIAKSSSQPSMYVKINENCGVIGTAGSISYPGNTTDAEGNVVIVPPVETPPKLRCIISYTKFKSYDERVLAENPENMIWRYEGSVEVAITTEKLSPPEGWTPPEDQTKLAAYWLKACLYVILKTIPEFADYVDYQ